MAHVHESRPWKRIRAAVGRGRVLDESDWLDRRTILKAMGFGGAMLAGVSCAQEIQSASEEDPTTAYPASTKWVPDWSPVGGKASYPAPRNQEFEVRRSLTPEDAAAGYNNFYEFYPGSAGPVHSYVGSFTPRPWQIEIGGEVEEPKTIDVDELAKIADLEERLYHFRCVETWAMIVPWTGIPMADFVKWCKPKSEARFVRFTSFSRPKPGAEPADYERRSFFSSDYPFPYYEGLRLEEAVNPLAMLVTGIYGHGLPMQHGACVRVIVPWKYGYKSPKSIARIEFLKQQPATFWSDLQPTEYPFESNVDPAKPHPRWSQATEWDVATRERYPTLPYNGYGDYVAKLYG